MKRLTCERFLSVPVEQPQTTSGGIGAQYMNLKNSEAVRIEVILTQAVADATVVSLWQDKSQGTGSADEKALGKNVQIWHDPDVSFGGGYEHFTRQTDSDSFTVAASAANMHIVFYVRQADLDIDNGYTHIGVKISDSTQATNFASVLMIFESRYQGAEIEETHV